MIGTNESHVFIYEDWWHSSLFSGTHKYIFFLWLISFLLSFPLSIFCTRVVFNRTSKIFILSVKHSLPVGLKGGPEKFVDWPFVEDSGYCQPGFTAER